MNTITLMYKRNRWRTLVLLLLLLATIPGRAQTYIEYNAPATISGGTVDEYQYIFVGPNADLNVEGDWYILAGNLYIHPSASITGTGTLHIMDLATFGTAGAAVTTVDGGGVPLSIAVSIENPQNVSLGVIDPNAVAAGLGYTDNLLAPGNSLVIGNTLNFGAAGGDLLLNDQQLNFTAAGTYTYSDLNTVNFPVNPAPPATPNGAIVVTNQAGEVLKQGLSTTFKFPIGIAEGDYTPATVSSPAAAGNFFAQVKSYSGSSAQEANPAEGMDRSWRIYSNNAGNATLQLQHNTSTNGASFTDVPAFVTQYQGNATWSTASLNVDYVGAGDMAGSVLHQHVYAIPNAASNNGAWFSKASDPVSPLPVTWVSFDAKAAGNCTVQLVWVTGSEQNSDHFGIERRNDNGDWKEIGRVKAAGQSSSSIHYAYLDKEPAPGVNHYRLRQVDKDGKQEYSVIRSVSKPCEAYVLKVYPTLNKTGIVFVSMPSGYENAQLRLFSANGQQQMIRNTGNGLTRTVYLSSLPAGTYILQVIHQNKPANFRIVYAP